MWSLLYVAQLMGGGTHLRLSIDQQDSILVDGNEENLGELWFSGLL